MQDKGKEEQETDGSWHCGWRGLGEWSMGQGWRIVSSKQQESSRAGRMTGSEVVDRICTCSLVSMMGSTVCMEMLTVLETKMATKATRGLRSWLRNKRESNSWQDFHTWPRPSPSLAMLGVVAPQPAGIPNSSAIYLKKS